MKIAYHNIEEVNDEEIKIAVIVAKYKDKIVLCKHKERDTWEMPGGHREFGELPESEMGIVQFFDELPGNMTYPTTHPDLYEKAMELK